MEYLQVELKKTKYIAYRFDGKESSAKEFCRKWNCDYVEDFLDKDLVSIDLPNKLRCYAGNYVVIDGDNFTVYSKDEFTDTFKVIPNYRQGNYTFMSEDWEKGYVSKHFRKNNYKWSMGMGW